MLGQEDYFFWQAEPAVCLVGSIIHEDGCALVQGGGLHGGHHSRHHDNIATISQFVARREEAASRAGLYSTSKTNISWNVLEIHRAQLFIVHLLLSAANQSPLLPRLICNEYLENIGMYFCAHIENAMLALPDSTHILLMYEW